MARARGDSTRVRRGAGLHLDRIADGAFFGGLAWWSSASGTTAPLGAAALSAWSPGQLVSYVKARAEGLGLTADGGLVERAERLISRWSAPGWRARGAVRARTWRCGCWRGVAAWSRWCSGWSRCTGAAGAPTRRARPATADPASRTRRSPSGSPTLGYAAGWRAGPAPAPRRGWRAAPSGSAPTGPPAAAAPGTPPAAREPAPGWCPDADPGRAGRAGPRRAALVRPVLAGGVPAAVAWTRRDARRHGLRPRSAVELLGARSAAGPGRGRRAAARRQLGRRRGLVVARAAAGRAFTTVAERLKPEALYRAVPRVPRGARDGDHPADRGGRPRTAC